MTNEICNICGRTEKLATKDNLKGMTWLDNEQCWVCDSCLKRKSLHILRGEN